MYSLFFLQGTHSNLHGNVGEHGTTNNLHGTVGVQGTHNHLHGTVGEQDTHNNLHGTVGEQWHSYLLMDIKMNSRRLCIGWIWSLDDNTFQ